MSPVQGSPETDMSMDEILASIKKIVVDDTSHPVLTDRPDRYRDDVAAPSWSGAAPDDDHEMRSSRLGAATPRDVLPLTQLVRDDGVVVDVTRLKPAEREALTHDPRASRVPERGLARSLAPRSGPSDSLSSVASSPVARSVAPPPPLGTRGAMGSDRWSAYDRVAAVPQAQPAAAEIKPSVPPVGRATSSRPETSLQGPRQASDTRGQGVLETMVIELVEAALSRGLAERGLAERPRDDLPALVRTWMEQHVPAMVEAAVRDSLAAMSKRRS